MRQPVFEALAECARRDEPVALGVITGVKGSSPQKLGAKALFYADGRIKGTLGGGCLEAEVQQRAVQALRTGRPECFELLLDHDFGWDDGLICGGKVVGLILPNAQTAGPAFWERLAERSQPQTWSITRDFKIAPGAAAEAQYTETVSPPMLLWIAGAGHIARAVAPLALQLDFEVTVLDDRPALVHPDYFPPGVRLMSDTWERLLSLPIPDRPLFGLIVTRGHRHDAMVLREWVRMPFRFIGMIGSKRKARTIFDHFREEKLATPEQMERVGCPVGIPIRAQSVPEIAVSILGQFIEKRAELITGPEPQAHPAS